MQLFSLNLILIKRNGLFVVLKTQTSLTSQKNLRHLDTLRKSLDLYSAHYENTILIGDFNVSIDDPHIESFCESYRFKSLIKDPTCFKNPESPSCIDLILTNNPYSFQNSWVIETGLSDFYKMIVSVMKTTFQKLKPRIVQYRDYTQFSNDNFRKKLMEKLCLENINTNSNKNTYVAIICHFLIKNYLVHTNKERN